MNPTDKLRDLEASRAWYEEKMRATKSDSLRLFWKNVLAEVVIPQINELTKQQ